MTVLLMILLFAFPLIGGAIYMAIRTGQLRRTYPRAAATLATWGAVSVGASAVVAIWLFATMISVAAPNSARFVLPSWSSDLALFALLALLMSGWFVGQYDIQDRLEKSHAAQQGQRALRSRSSRLGRK